MQKLRLALDWTPNANHSGFYVALARGWYKEANIDLEIFSPSPEYESHETPARRIMNGDADICVAPSESLISCWTTDESKGPKPVCVATLLQASTSAIVTLKGSGISSLAQLDATKTYASYTGRFEMNIVRQMIKNAGGM